MPWAVKVVARVRRPGQSAAQLLTRLGQAEGELSAGVVAAVLPLEPGATVAWSMRVAAQPNAPEGNNVYETYPKLRKRQPSGAAGEAYCKEQGLLHGHESKTPSFTDTVELDLATVEPSLAGPKRPQDRIPLSTARRSFRSSLMEMIKDKTSGLNADDIARWVNEKPSETNIPSGPQVPSFLSDVLPVLDVKKNGSLFTIGHGSVVITAITSCTNTSNPSVMVAAGLLAKKAVERGLRAKPWVKTSLAPGSKVVTDY